MARNQKEVQEDINNNPAIEGQDMELMSVDEAVQEEHTAEEAVQEEPTAEEAALAEALSQDDVVAALTELKETATGKLPAFIATYIALKNALGDESPATQNALSNLQTYKTDVVKPAKEPKAKVFNEKTALAAALKEQLPESEDVQKDITPKLRELQEDARISEKLKALLVTYLTLAAIEDEALAPSVELALTQLRAYASKSKSLANKNSTRLGQPSVRLKTKVVTKDGQTFVAATLAAAIRLLGNEDKDYVLKAWKQIGTAKFKAGEVIEFEGHKFSLTDEGIETPTEPAVEGLDETSTQEGYE